MAARSLFSSSWYRVAALKPRLRNHAEIHRQRYRGQVWYVLQDHASGRYHRFSPAAHFIIGLMDGERTMAEIWELAAARLGHELPSQDELIQLLGQLHGADVLHSGVPPDLVEMAERSQKQRRREFAQKVRNPMAVRLPLIDPDHFLDRTLHLVRPLFGPLGIVIWLAAVIAAGVLVGMHWNDLSANIVDRVLSAENIGLMLLAYPVIKALHELGHGYAVKRWGGEVHEMGIMFLVLMPVPYVEASASSAFREKWRRAAVGGAGVLVELFLAALATFVWVLVEPGLVRTLAFNTMLIAGVSTVLFNGNPLLRFDGYYVLADVLEIPNFGTRANRHLLYLVQRYLFGVRDLHSPASAPGERTWFVVYGIAAFVYRLFIMTAIALFVATKFFVVGVLLALWAVAIMVIVPLVKGAWFVLTDARVAPVRTRAVAVVAVFVAVVAVFLLRVPVPYATVAEGIVWVPERAMLVAEADGIVRVVRAPPDSPVHAGDVVFELDDPTTAARVRVFGLRLEEERLRLAAIDLDDRVEAARLRERIVHVERELDRARQHAEAMLVRSHVDGRLVLVDAADLPGRFVRRGDLLGYVVDFGEPTLRVIVPQSDIDLVRWRSANVLVRFANTLDEVIPAVVRKETPEATSQLPSLVLSTLGGGAVAMDPTDPTQATSLETVFVLDLGLGAPVPYPAIASRAYVRFDHGSDPLAGRLQRMVRQLFLRTFGV